MAKIDTSTLGFLNKDDEERLLPKGDYTDALNIRRRISSGNVPFPVKNVLGDSKVTNTLFPSGDNFCIGGVDHAETNNYFFFLWNSNDNHGIFQYNTITNSITRIYIDSVLNFQKGSYITDAVALSGLSNDGVLLYFTDNFNPPRKINVKRAILHYKGDYTEGYAQEFTTGTDAQKSKFIEAVKYPPLSPPSFEFVNDSNQSFNNIVNDVFQFRYQYVYDDGEYSAFSPWSKLAYSTLQSFNDALVRTGYTTSENVIRLTLDTAPNNVERIVVTYRKGNIGTEFKFVELENNPSQSTITTDFANKTIGEAIGDNDAAKTHDLVPLFAKAQTFKNNYLFYGNTVDGYDPPDVNISTYVSYKEAPDYDNSTSVPVQNGQILPLPLGECATLFIDFELNFSTSVTGGKVFIVDVKSTSQVIDDSSNLPKNKIIYETFKSVYTAQAGDDIDDVVDFFVDFFNNKPLVSGLGSSKASNQGAGVLKITIAYDENIVGCLGLFNLKFPTDDSEVVDIEPAKRTFKSGANHPLAVQYYDRANRPFPLVKIDDPYVRYFSERDGVNQPYGRATINTFLINTPPFGATHYQILYAGSTIGEYLDFTTAGVYAAVSSSSNTNDFSRVYVSLRNFSGSDISFRETTGAEINYNFTEGDRIRIKSYYNPDESQREIVSGYLDFKVVGLETLPNDVDLNPLIESGDSDNLRIQKSGLFLIVENPQESGFAIEDVINGDSFWFNTSQQEGAYFEIYRPGKASQENVYYEIGETYNIANPNTENRYHEGGIRDQNETPVYTVISQDVDEDSARIVDVDPMKLAPGDIVQLNRVDGGKNYYTIRKIDVLNSIEFTVFFEENITSNTFSTMELLNPSAAIVLEDGDSYFKPRSFFEGGSTLGFDISVANVESYYVNDFIDSNAWGKGRGFAFSPNAKQQRRKSTVWVSEPFFSQDNVNGLSSFNPILTPFRDYEQSYGGIQTMRPKNEGIVLWQEDKTSLAYVERELIESTDGGQSLALKDQVLGVQRFYQGDYGISQNPESLSDNDGVFYWLDIKRGRYLRLAGDGIFPVSDYKMRQYFYDKQGVFSQNYAGVAFPGGFDKINEEAIVSFPEVIKSEMTVGGDTATVSFSNVVDAGFRWEVPVRIEIPRNPNQLVWGNESRNWEDICENWEDWGGPLYTSEEIAETGKIGLGYAQYYQALANSGLILVYVNFNTDNGQKLVQCTLNVKAGELYFTKGGYLCFPALDFTNTTVSEEQTVAFYEPAKRFSTFYSFNRDFYGLINSVFLSFLDGELYLHGRGSTYGNFAGVDYKTQVKPVLNEGAFDAKMFFAAVMESNDTWDLTLSTNLNSSTLAKTRWDLREGAYYAELPRATTGTTTGNVTGLSDVTNISGNTITIAQSSMQGSGIYVGLDVYSGGVKIGEITSLNSDTGEITLDSIGGLSVGDFVYLFKPLITNGDLLRGDYLAIDMENNTHDKEVELYTVRVETKKSFP